MEWVETTGKTIEEAKELALDQLGVDSSDAEFEVLNEPKMSLFGRLKVEARVRARVRPTSPRPKESNQRRGRKDSERRDQKSTKSTNTKVEQESTSERQSAEPKSRPAKPRRQAKPASNTDEGASKMEDQVPLSQQGEVAEEFLSGLFEQLQHPISIAVSTQDEDELINVGIEGEDLGHLIGPRGSTLHSLQEITRTVVQRKTGARNGRILVDIARYREKRREALERFSRQVAEEVLASGEQRILEPMNPADRKVVHDVINTFDGVATTSEGEEPRRRVVIKPA
jgi:spoIIIJ-associated protein